MPGSWAASINASPQEEAHLGSGLLGISLSGGTQGRGAALYHLLSPSGRVRQWVWGARRWAVGERCSECQPSKGLGCASVALEPTLNRRQPRLKGAQSPRTHKE